MHQDPRIEAAAKAIYDIRDDEFSDDEWGDMDSNDRELYTCQATAALAAADEVAVLVASHHVRRDWANHIETWEGTVGGPVCSPLNIVAALRAKGTPFGVSANDGGTE